MLNAPLHGRGTAFRAAPLLEVSLIPRPTWGPNVRSAVSRERWRALRRTVLRLAGRQCQACRRPKPPLHCHEVFVFDDSRRVQRLAGYRALCADCHGAVHAGKAYACGGENGLQRALDHLASVNGWSDTTARNHFREALAIWERRCQHPWTVVLPQPLLLPSLLPRLRVP